MLLLVCKSIACSMQSCWCCTGSLCWVCAMQLVFSGLHALTCQLSDACLSECVLTQYSQAFGVIAGQNGADKHKSSCSCIFKCSSSSCLIFSTSFSLSCSASFSLSYSASFSLTYSVSFSFCANKGSRCTDELWYASVGSRGGHDRRRVLGWLAGDRAKPS